ncbi:MAG: hypothetical protein R6U64_07200 [Bacteroidales bacterium]
MYYSNKNLKVIINRRQERLVTIKMQLLKDHPLVEETFDRLIAATSVKILFPGLAENHSKN